MSLRPSRRPRLRDVGESARLHPAPLLLVALLLVGGLAACSGEEAPADRPEETAAPAEEASPTPEPVVTKVRIDKVAGRLPAPRRRAVKRQVTEVVDRWFEEKWTGGEWPREIKGDFPGFTRDASRAARRHLGVVTASDLAGRIEGVEVARQTARLDVLAPRGRAVGVTARIVLDLETVGDVERTVRVRGRLALTRVDGRWKVFAYDLTQGKR